MSLQNDTLDKNTKNLLLGPGVADVDINAICQDALSNNLIYVILKPLGIKDVMRT